MTNFINLKNTENRFNLIDNLFNRLITEKELEKIIVKDDDNMIITLLDVEGNINSWESGSSIKTVVNLFDMKDISTEYKNKQFFSMGYPYFIKSNKDFYAFSSDHGVFLLKK